MPRLIKHGKTGLLIDRSLNTFREAIDSMPGDNLNVGSIIRNAIELVNGIVAYPK